MYKSVIRPILFQFDPEKIHHFIFSFLKIVQKIPFVPQIFRVLFVVEDKRLEREIFGLKFKNPVGLAAGFDKDAKLYKELSNFGFGFIEIRSEEHTSELQSRENIVCSLLLEKKKTQKIPLQA